MGWQMGVGEPHDHYLSPEQAKRFYDRLGARQDWQGFYENAALQELIAHSGFDSARAVLEFGCGTGAFAARLLRQHLPPEARYKGLDVSSTMVSLARKRLQPWPQRAQVHQSDGSASIHQPNGSFDRFVSNYVFDLLAPGFVEQLLLEARRVLVPGGKLCLVSLTLGVSHLSRVLSSVWQRLWRFSPSLVGGCHPIELTDYLSSKTWNVEHQAILVRWGLPSEVLVASSR